MLAVEDVAVNRELMRLFLETEGHHVDLACDGEEAVAAVRRNSYDIVLMDMQMPHMDGMDATRAIRAMGGELATVPIIALSANIMPDQVKMCMDAGMTAHLSKPFSSADLMAQLARWTGGCAARNEILATLTLQAGSACVKGLLEMLRAQIDALEMCAVDDLQNLRRQAHALRGAAAMLGYETLSAACGALEQACVIKSDPTSMLQFARRAAGEVHRSIAAELC